MWKPQNTVAVDDDKGEKLLKLMEMLNEHDDVQNVYANFEVSDALMAKAQRLRCAPANTRSNEWRHPCKAVRPMAQITTKPRTKVELKTERPRLHKVILVNDDFTPREFVVTSSRRSSA